MKKPIDNTPVVEATSQATEPCMIIDFRAYRMRRLEEMQAELDREWAMLKACALAAAAVFKAP